MQTLEIGKTETADLDKGESGPRRTLKRAGRIALWTGFMFGYLNGYVSRVVNQRPWLWTLSIVVAFWLIIAIDRLGLWLYMKYAPSIFVREDR